uniref:Mini-chromosome maintenance complex-binding protein n=1 Tax=Kwoniella bestiolae CBS 10118 TaxID=1296100 RepID=A0A1B9FVY4_9TREE|nr:hypothetical protein I302_07270 [Kwoniella bestiolae CBS 10118]OCF22920.1 hypothetical protein I302_07270 [Kwoniella bestiolae CBS 10118]
MSTIEEIIRTAHREHDHPNEGESSQIDGFVELINRQLGDVKQIPQLSKATRPLSLVSFRCLLQDTGYPMEVYLPGDGVSESDVDWSKLKERWVGWGVEIPGEQSWAKGGNVEEGVSSLPTSVHAKYPLPGSKGDYIGALVKVYEDAAFKPASTHHFLGILSSSPLPSNEPENAEMVPTIHVLRRVEEAEAEPVEDVREELVNYLATAFTPPDRVAGEYLLLLLLSSPTSRPTSMTPLGTLSVNFKRKDELATARFGEVVGAVTPRVVPIPLSVSLLHSHPFFPSSTDSSSLDAGLLQLSEGTVLVVEEDAMGSGGQLNEKAVKNLKALAECMTEQRLRYEYPYMEGLKMDCATRVVVLSQGKSLLPVDIDIPVKGTGEVDLTRQDLSALRNYLGRLSSLEHAMKLEIPDDTAELIQDAFIQGRKENAESAEETLKRRMKVARLMALSYPEAKLTKEVWDKVVKMDEEAVARKL